MFIRFDMIHERDRQTPDDAIGRAYASHHAAINDLVDTCGSYCDMYIFADDAKFYRHIEHPDDQNFCTISNQCITSVVREMAVKS